MERQQQKDPSQDGSDRRRAPRHEATQLGKLITRVIGGGEVTLLDFSRSGVLIESDTRLTIGQKATIRLTTTDATLTVTGKVVRSRVASVNGAIVYHTAFALDDDLTALEQNVSKPRKASKKESRAPARGSGAETGPSAIADDARGSEHAYSTNPDASVGASVDPILEFLATVPHDLAELRRRAAVNNW